MYGFNSLGEIFFLSGINTFDLFLVGSNRHEGLDRYLDLEILIIQGKYWQDWW